MDGLSGPPGSPGPVGPQGAEGPPGEHVSSPFKTRWPFQILLIHTTNKKGKCTLQKYFRNVHFPFVFLIS